MSQTETTDDEALKGWDKGAFWYPTFDRRGALLGLFLLFGVLQFNELFGLHTDATMLFGWLPTNMAYYVGLTIGHIIFMFLIYLNWPYPTDSELDVGTAEEEPTVTTTGEAEDD